MEGMQCVLHLLLTCIGVGLIIATILVLFDCTRTSRVGVVLRIRLTIDALASMMLNITVNDDDNVVVVVFSSNALQGFSPVTQVNAPPPPRDNPSMCS
eukprot:scaffold4869_cov183-Amphora_coffeaeformis.AAC.7